MKSKYSISDHFDGNRFYNLEPTLDKSTADLLKWSLNRTKPDYPKWIENSFSPQKITSDILTEKQIALTFINHVTFLIQTPSVTILTDPVWSERASPLQFAGPARIRPAGMPINLLPKIDVIVVSHNHYDHMDIPTLKFLSEKHRPLIVVPLGNAQYFKSFKFKNIIELDWWQFTEFNLNKIYLVPARHWSARGLHDKRKALWGGFVIESAFNKIYFAGDTGFSEKIFQQIYNKFSHMDLSLLPIGAYEPRWFMKEMHMSPEDSVLAHQILKSKQSVAMHFGTFRLTDEAWLQPEADLKLAKEKYQVDPFEILEVGQTRIYF